MNAPLPPPLTFHAAILTAADPMTPSPLPTPTAVTPHTQSVTAATDGCSIPFLSTASFNIYPDDAVLEDSAHYPADKPTRVFLNDLSVCQTALGLSARRKPSFQPGTFLPSTYKFSRTIPRALPVPYFISSILPTTSSSIMPISSNATHGYRPSFQYPISIQLERCSAEKTNTAPS